MNEQILQKAKNIKLFAMDVDGVLSDGQIIYDAQGVETKAFFVQDGLGLQAVRQAGVVLAIITGRSSAMVERRAKELGIAHVIQGRDDKFVALMDLAAQLGLDLSECAYMGDDLPDLKAVREAGFGISVANGCLQTQAVADYVTQKTGGQGAVREVCELILQAQDKFDDFVKKFQ
ncbi:3-deoxy-D-manno-octulosonate 8-phosphate phosphatase (KDO 8-P phosphatase) [Moraxella cuniculi DSM 21768]|uniref:3-deoxy-D-manno-octulosonate 8-phosphate phosphatase KdsC n=1 Tax=Moraxella cuniculi DSM 21768 TaxID=1122245 RepID=A0A1N7FJT0_9GAMM|nr:HAD hydrolase family protein [Moraxella cuniculi]OOS02231.1 HAD family hydrolase [Moraxella cuniculi]SIS00534.1 3-deoxy-D-manno-octulosonate 8-phosphate phosphatase (KDO 8-P phosphatase) [Moraxella cuniculi DSM 21768]